MRLKNRLDIVCNVFLIFILNEPSFMNLIIEVILIKIVVCRTQFLCSFKFFWNSRIISLTVIGSTCVIA